MDLLYTAEDEAFRQDVRGFIADNLPAETKAWMLSGRHPGADAMRGWMHILAERGWSTPGWPKAYGGPGWTPLQRYIFGEELQMAPAPTPLPFNVAMVGPVIYTFGNDAQKARFLPRIARLDDWWCQGFSEPGAGSDLASLTTSARRDGDHYIINGQKTWTSYAQHADWMFLLARTNPTAKKQAGISFLLMDMKSPGITVRPITTIDGGHEVNEVFLDEVRVPAENLVGEENGGWNCAKFLLGHERLSIARIGTSKQRLRRIRELAATEQDGGRPMLENPRFLEKLAALEVELMALEITQLRVISAALSEHAGPDPRTSMLKLKGSQIQQATTELLLELAGPYALPLGPQSEAPYPGWNKPDAGPSWASIATGTYFNWRKVSIYGGSNEIQRGIIAKAILGL